MAHGKKTGGRKKGSLNKRTIGLKEAAKVLASQEPHAPVKPPDMDSLDAQRQIAKTLMGMAAAEQQRVNADRMAKKKVDDKRLQDLLEAASRVWKEVLPYEHRRLATLQPAMETVVKPDGSVHVTISKTDADI